MIIHILCSNPSHPVFAVMKKWQKRISESHDVYVFTMADDCFGGDLLFLISCNEIVGHTIRSRYAKVLVIHASDLPSGRGWSPLIWQILEGQSEVVVTLFEAAEKVDDGDIWKKMKILFDGHELVDEINDMLFETEVALMDFAVENFGIIEPRKQPDAGVSYYRKRNPDDSRLDPDKTIREQFDLLRVSDPDRYPAFVVLNDHRYRVRIDKINE